MLAILALAGTDAIACPIEQVTIGSSATSVTETLTYKLDVIDVQTTVELRTIAPVLAFDATSKPDEITYLLYEEILPNFWGLVVEDGPHAVGTTLEPKESPELGVVLLAGTRYAMGFRLGAGDYDLEYESLGTVTAVGTWGDSDGNLFSGSGTSFGVPVFISQVPSSSTYHMDVEVEVFDLDDWDCDGSLNTDDCEPLDETRYPGAPELCNSLDDDCDQLVDEGVTYVSWHLDGDEDGYGQAGDGVEVCDGTEPVGRAPNDEDCDDADATVNPDAVELCDGIDRDCDGMIDNDPYTFIQYADRDGDGFGDPDRAAEICDGEPLDDHVDNALDCDDTSDLVSPDATEICDAYDNDCNDLVDDGLPTRTVHPDADGDGFGDRNASVETCFEGLDGHLTDGTDCDDSNASRFPGNPEICDGSDNDCDLVVPPDEGDSDADTWPDCNDCAPDDPTIHPGALEPCDGVDHDCDGQIRDVSECDPSLDEGVVLNGCSGCDGGHLGALGVPWLVLPIAAMRRRRSTVVLAPGQSLR